jgi:hypothetical protein
MTQNTDSYRGFVHAGAGTSQVIVLLSVMIPGLLPSLALIGVITAVLVLPVVALGLAATVVITTPLGLWRLATRGRRRHRRQERARRIAGEYSGSSRRPLNGDAATSAHLSTPPVRTMCRSDVSSSMPSRRSRLC